MMRRRREEGTQTASDDWTPGGRVRVRLMMKDEMTLWGLMSQLSEMQVFAVQGEPPGTN